MADITRAQNRSVPDTMITRFRDMGDGTHALVISAALILGGAAVGAANPIPITITDLVVPISGTVTATVSGQVSLANPLDEVSGALETIAYEHHEVHEGNTWMASYKTADGGPLADNASLTFLIQTTTKKLHLAYAAACGGDCEVLVYEDMSVSNIGTGMVEYNMNRSSVAMATASVSRDPTFTGGNLILNLFEPGGTKQQATGGTARAGTELIFATQQVYAIRLTNRAGSVQPASIVVQWYEK